MQQEEFLRRLRELAEIRSVKVPRTAGRREAEEPEEIWRQGQKIEISRRDNPTLAIEVVKLKSPAQACEDCGRVSANRCVNTIQYTYPLKHWRRHCATCNLVQNPTTGQFDIEMSKSQIFFVNYYKKQDK